MTLEWVTAIAAVGTFLVIAASAVAALVQLRHIRASNQIAALNEAREVILSPDFAELVRFIRAELPQRLDDPDVRRALVRRSWHHDVPAEYRRLATVPNYFEQLGMMVKKGVLDAEFFCELYCDVTSGLWEAFGPLVVQRRIVTRVPALWENFEYIAVLSDDWLQRHSTGTYPRGTRRSTFPEWPETREAAGARDDAPALR